MLLFFIMLPFGKELQEIDDIIKQDSASILRGEQGAPVAAQNAFSYHWPTFY